jgi:hypothetical protein
MFSSRDAFENDFCPVRDELLGEMYRANANGLPLLVESVSSEVRSMLALFCYRRSHLHSLALAIAATRRPCRLHALRPVARTGHAFRALVVLRQPQADHALDQTALDLRADGRRSRRRRFRGSRHGVILPPVVPAPVRKLRTRRGRQIRSHQHRQSVPPSRHRAFGIAGHAGSAYLGPHRIDGA